MALPAVSTVMAATMTATTTATVVGAAAAAATVMAADTYSTQQSNKSGGGGGGGGGSKTRTTAAMATANGTRMVIAATKTTAAVAGCEECSGGGGRVAEGRQKIAKANWRFHPPAKRPVFDAVLKHGWPSAPCHGANMDFFLPLHWRGNGCSGGPPICHVFIRWGRVLIFRPYYLPKRRNKNAGGDPRGRVYAHGQLGLS
jgi:hypothetical protein